MKTKSTDKTLTVHATTRLVAVACSISLIALAGCGGDSGEDSTPPSTTPNTTSVEHALAIRPDAWVTVPAPVDLLFKNLTIPADAPVRGMWSSVYDWHLVGLHATVLPTGRVLTYGSRWNGEAQEGREFDVWTPERGLVDTAHNRSWDSTRQDSFCSTAAFLTDGRLLITGGNGAITSTIYTPSTNSSVTASANLADQRWYATMITLPDGRPLIMGGMVPYGEQMRQYPEIAVGNGSASMTPEVYENGAWRSLFGAYSRDAFGPDYLRASYPRAWVMPSGQVFGVSAERLWSLDPSGNGTVTIHGAFKKPPAVPKLDVPLSDLPNVGSTNTAVMFDIGKVLIAGGHGTDAGDNLPASSQATVIDMNSGSPVLTEQPPMTFRRRFPNAVVLPDGKVVITGGSMEGDKDGANAVYAAEIWNPVTGTWTLGPNAGTYRGYHSFTVLLPNGTVLSTGGGLPGPVINRSAEVYYPPQLFRSVDGVAQLAPRPVMQGISGLSYSHGAPMQIDMTTTAPVSKLVLIGLSSGTHSFNSGQRRIPLSFMQDTQRLTTKIPNANLVPPGYYQVVAIDAQGVPSRGTIISIGQDVKPPPTPTTPYNPPDLSAPIDAPVIAQGATASYTFTAAPDTLYSWEFGDGTSATTFSPTASIQHTFAQPGLYAVTLTARARDGAISRRTIVQAVATPRTARQPNASSAMALETRAGASTRLWVVNPDGDSVAVIDTATQERIAEIAVGNSPRSVAVAPDGRIWVANKGAASISIISPTTLAVVQTVALPRASQPHGLAFAPVGASAFVVLEATGQLLKLDASTGAQRSAVAIGPNPRHLSVSSGGGVVFVSRFITPPLPGESTAMVNVTTAGAEVVVVQTGTMTVSRTVVLRHSDKTDTETQGAGVPNYLAAPIISPDAQSVWVPSKQDNIRRGTLRNGQNLDFQNTVRAISSRIDVARLTEDYERRIDHDNASVASAAAFHPSGVYLFVALETSRQIAVVNAVRGGELFRVDVGFAPQGVAVSADGSTLYAQNFMDRTVSVIDLSPLVQHGELRAPVAATVKTVENERLPAQVLQGKKLFYDARDPRLARDSYMSCASCHNDAGHDGRVWDMTGFGEGLRNTISLKGRAGTGHGFLHWSANFDEVQDFEAQIRSLSGGTGLMTDVQFNADTTREPLGTPKAGKSADLDALAAYLASQQSFEPSPYRQADGTLTLAAWAGKAVFRSAGCANCHGGAPFTISANAGMLKNIGTLKPGSGKRLGATLNGIDVPTLRDVWSTAPYLHDGSAPTLSAAIQAHAGNTVSGVQLSYLTAYLQQIGREEPGQATFSEHLSRPPSPGKD